MPIASPCAIAGFSPEEVELMQYGPELPVTGQKKLEDRKRQFLHQGPTVGNFKQVFKLADYVKVANASLENGLLAIELTRENPEEKKPRRIDIGSSVSAASVKDTGPTEQISPETKQRKAA
jgi:molecular chaperone IbpA